MLVFKERLFKLESYTCHTHGHIRNFEFWCDDIPNLSRSSVIIIGRISLIDDKGEFP